jgi:thiol-disulfide isomerase/thioredoxin
MSKRAIIAPAEVNRRARRNRMFLYVTLGLAVAIVIAVVAFYSRVPKTASTAPLQANIKVGDSAPEFAVATTNGPFDLKQVQATGKPVFLEVFATWCPHCQREVTTIDALYKKFGNQIAFVGVSGSPYGMDGSTPESQSDVIQFQQQLGVAYPIAYDPGLDVAGKYLTGGYPTIAIIDKSGKVAYLNSGELSSADLTKQINKVIQ